MELRAGYKRTEVGMIPEEWMVRSIGDVFFVEAGGDMDYSRSVIIQDERHPFPIYSNAITNRGLHGFSSYGDHPSGSITVTARGTLGAANYRDHDFTAIGRVLVLVPKISLDGRFFAEYLNNCVSFAVESTGVPQLTAPQISKYRVPVPPIHEQRAIAAALSDVDALISSLDKLIAKKRDIKQAAMQQLLTGKRRLPGFCGEWVSRRIGDISDSSSGGTPLSSVSAYYGGSIPWVSISDMTSSGKYLVMTERSLTDEGLAASAAKVFPAGTVLYAMYASIGECSIAAIELCSSQAILGIRPRESCDGHYLYYWLVSKKDEVRAMGQHGTQANLNADMVKDFRVPLPTIDEQRAIANVLSDMDAEIEALERRRDKTRLLKQGMMQELLTGRVRLV